MLIAPRHPLFTVMFQKRMRESDRSSVRDHGAFGHHNDAVSDEVVFSILVRRFTIWRDHDSFPNPSVFVDNGALNVAVASDAKWWSARPRFPGFCLVKACPHQDRVADRGAAFDHAPNPDERPVEVRIGNDAAIGNNRPLKARSSDLAG